jgi:ketol-acid reductoisomerase
MKVWFDEDCDISLVRSKRVAVLGYGNQGRPQALNLRDSGVAQLVVAARSGERPEADGFDVMTPAGAAGWADIVVMLIPDEAQAQVYKEELEPHLRPGSALAFAHGLNIHFKLIGPRPDLDVFLGGSKGPGDGAPPALRAR